jgi:small conductance mechanosensitive channel
MDIQYISEFVKSWAIINGMNLIAALVIFIIGKIIAGWLKRISLKIFDKLKIDITLGKFLSNVVYALIFAFVIIMALGRLGVETNSLVAILGAAGLAVGFALQSSLSNFAAGIMLLFFRPIKVGDYIEAGGTSGTVEEVHIFSTKLKTPDNKIIFVPNGAITSGNIVNYSMEQTRRVDMAFGIGYADDIKKAKDVLYRILSEDDRILKDPAPLIAVSELADSSVNFAVRPWVNKENYWGVYFDTLEKVKLEFDKENISIPFPQTDVHLFKKN